MLGKGVLKQKKAQVTLFILIAIAIFAVVLVIFYPRIKVFFAPSTPVNFVEECVKEDVENAIKTLSLQGGSIKPSFYLENQGIKIEYLCYTNLYFKTCVMQQPMLKQHIEREIKEQVEGKAKACISGLKEEMEKRGYAVSGDYKSLDVRIAPSNIIITLNAKIAFTKESTQTFNNFEIRKASSLYTLVMMATSILNFEARYGDSETMTYMFYYPSIKVEKVKQGDGSKIYSLTDISNNEKFVFATRSLSFPGGYKLSL